MRFGIGITTRNRPAVLKLALIHHNEFRPPDSVIVVVDDDSSTQNQKLNQFHCAGYKNVIYIRSMCRLGISRAKTRCLRELRKCQHIFLFDDDAFPMRENWTDVWVNASVPHLTFSMDLHKLVSATGGSSHLTMIHEGETYDEYTGALGCVLYMDRMCVEVVGGFDPRFGVYGYEHAQYTKRCHMAGLSPALYCAPKRVMESVYTLDMHLKWLGEYPPFVTDAVKEFNTSVTRAEADAHVKYSHLMEDCPIFISLEVPICALELP